MIRPIRPLPWFALLLLSPWLAAEWAAPFQVPIERMLPQLEARVAEDPKDAHAQYLLGRVNGAAFARGVASVEAWTQYPDRVPQLFERERKFIAETEYQAQSRTKLPPLSPEALCAHLSSAVQHLSRAVELAPENSLYQLGFANALDSGAHLASMVNSTVMAPSTFGELSNEDRARCPADVRRFKLDTRFAAGAEQRLIALGYKAIPFLNECRADPNATRQVAIAGLLSDAWRELAIEHYQRAFALAFARESTIDELHTEFLKCLTSYEAADSYIRLLKARGVRDEAEAGRLAEVEAGLKTLKAIPQPAWITPILIPERGVASLSELFDGSFAEFDLAGIGETQTWPWPKREASFLVWDPQCEGEIRSGRQLLGSATWWMFFEDGYRAIEALDVNADGWLTGAELEGLSLWRDANRDGECSNGEVQTLAQRGVVALSKRADGIDPDDCIYPSCSRGVILEDGSARASFDWVAARDAPRP
jgi:hypothetical protein